MNAGERRIKIINKLKESVKPLSGSMLAEELRVSRQVIVQDIAVLRASGYNLIATSQGYILMQESARSDCRRKFKCKHTESDIENELLTIIDMGGRIIDVAVEHKLYGEIKGSLMIKSPRDVRAFVEKMKAEGASALSTITGGVHNHTVEADSEAILDEIERALKAKNYLL